MADIRTRLSPWVAAGVGALGGGLSGLFGVGGGVLLVPGFVLLGKMAQRHAHATSLAAIVPIAVAGAAGYAFTESVDWRGAALLIAGSAVGAVGGTRVLGRLSDRTLRLVFAGFLLVAAVFLPSEVDTTGDPAPPGLLAEGLLVAVGVVAGVVAGLLGVGGGIVMVPGLVLLLEVTQAVAKGTSLVAIIPTALVGSVANARRGDVDFPAAAVSGVTGAAVAVGASFLAVRLDPLLSAALFGLLLVAMAIRLILAARGKPVPGERAG